MDPVSNAQLLRRACKAMCIPTGPLDSAHDLYEKVLGCHSPDYKPDVLRHATVVHKKTTCIDEQTFAANESKRLRSQDPHADDEVITEAVRERWNACRLRTLAHFKDITLSLDIKGINPTLEHQLSANGFQPVLRETHSIHYVRRTANLE